MRKPNNPIDALFMLREKFVGDEIEMGNYELCPMCLYVGCKSVFTSSAPEQCLRCKNVFGAILGFGGHEFDTSYCLRSPFYDNSSQINPEFREYLDVVLDGLTEADRNEVR